MRGAGKGGFDPGGIAIVIVERDIAGDVIIELRGAGFCRLRRIGHRGQRLDLKLHGFRSIARLRHCFRHDEGDGVADEAHLVARQRRAVGLQQRGAVAVL